MALSVTRARVKEKCGITDATYDSIIDNLIAEQVPVLEYSIRPEYIAATSNAGLQATLNLGALEVVCAEFFAIQRREPGACEELRLGEVSIRPDWNPAREVREHGLRRLMPFLKRGEATTGSPSILSSGGGATGAGGLE